MKKIKTYFYNLGIAIDQLFNALFNGYADETLSSRAYRLHTRYWYANYAKILIDFLFLWQTTDHCRKAYENELKRKHFPFTMEDIISTKEGNENEGK
ncbi:TPA: hypothetical protein ACYKJT_001650 [Campylobacter coli]|uniref:hypothetical protein n=1 Tax=Campylobacter coli TaxID=195 RepID=UPI004034D1C8